MERRLKYQKMQGTSLTIQPDCFPLSGYGRVVCTLSSLCKMTTAPAFLTPEVQPIEIISLTDKLEKLSMMGNEKLNWINSIQCFKGCNLVVISTEVWSQWLLSLRFHNDLIAAPSHLGNGGHDRTTPPNSLLHTLSLLNNKSISVSLSEYVLWNKSRSRGKMNSHEALYKGCHS